MEHRLKSFIRVVRQIDDAESLIVLLDKALSNPSSLTDQDRRRILDFPEPDVQAANIAASTTLSKAELLRRAVDSPANLTTSEIDLLKERYWLDISSRETRARVEAAEALLSVSTDHWREVTAELKRIREPLYIENEEDGIQKAEWEAHRRLMSGLQASQEAEAERALAKARPWVRRLWEEDKGQVPWGFAVFDGSPDKPGMEDYRCRRDGVLFHARLAIGCGDTIGARWMLQSLAWPSDSDSSSTSEGQRMITFRKLRELFTSIRERPQGHREGLTEGILRNVFLVIDQDAIDSVISRSGNVDDMWVWAVDPDYDADADASPEAEQVAGAYKGSLRVRLQQLANSFFEARRFHHDEYSIKDLWEAAQASKGQAFVSVKPEEAGLWTMNLTVGSALRPDHHRE